VAAVAGGGAATAGKPGPEALAALGLVAVPGLGDRRIRTLFERHGGFEPALAALRAGAPDVRLPAEIREAGTRARRADAEAVMRLLPPGGRVVVMGAQGYPSELLRLADPPPVLWLQGPLEAGSGRAVCVVGTRTATEYGRRMARRLAAGLAEAGWRIVSGLARGVDAEAHRGALEAGGETVGVPGCGLGHVYPASSRDLYAALRRRGLLLTELPPGERPAPAWFPRRNRILAGLSRAVLVVQAGPRSGALITAREAAEIGVDVLAVPGRADLAASEGSNALIRDGAGLVARVADALDALGEIRPDPDAAGPASPPGRGVRRHPAGGTGSPRNEAEDSLVRRLHAGPGHVDALAGEAGLGIPEALAALGRLEAAGLVRGLPGGRYEAIR
jgi:DNA processing protein